MYSGVMTYYYPLPFLCPVVRKSQITGLANDAGVEGSYVTSGQKQWKVSEFISFVMDISKAHVLETATFLYKQIPIRASLSDI